MNKKLLIWCSVVVLLVIIASLLPLMLFKYSDRWKYNAEFNEYEDEFNLVKNYLYDNYYGIEDWVSLSYDIENETMRLYLPKQNEYAVLSEDVSAALMTIRSEAFYYKDAVLDVIRIEENRVAFCIENGQYALIWSPDEKPVGLAVSDDVKTYVKRINSEWYHAVKKVD